GDGHGGSCVILIRECLARVPPLAPGHPAIVKRRSDSWSRGSCCSVMKYLCHSVPVPSCGPLVRGDGLSLGRGRWWRQVGWAKNFDRYRAVTLGDKKRPPDLHGCRSGGRGLLRRSGGDAMQ